MAKYNITKEERIEARRAMLDAMQVCLKAGRYEEARIIGESARLAGDKIKKMTAKEVN